MMETKSLLSSLHSNLREESKQRTQTNAVRHSNKLVVAERHDQPSVVQDR